MSTVHNRSRLPALTGLGLLLSLLGCSPGPGEPGARTEGLFGKDGPLRVSAPDTVVNRYAALTADAPMGAQKMQLAPPIATLGPGDLLLIIQMQGATINTADTAQFGAITDMKGAGLYEFAGVKEVSGNEVSATVTLDPTCGGLRNSYTAAGKVQVVRVPQLTTLTVDQGGSIVAPPWDGVTGGVVALHVRDAAQINGKIDTSGRGFRGGALHNVAQAESLVVTLYRSATIADGGEKGESIAGGAADYMKLGALFGRGAPANGGGGGNSHNAAGGGGANGNNGKMWSGQGVMDPGVTGAMAWQLDPGYKANGNKLTDSSGGGRGGYTFSQAMSLTVPNPLTAGPGAPGWGGNGRQAVGGMGGRPLNNDPATRLFFGGGGGAGSENDNAGGAGASGGGLVYLIAGAVQGSGQILANGATAPDNRNGQNDGGGGGGGGGAVVVKAGSLAGISISAEGGKGGTQQDSAILTEAREAEGPGAGGGGGYIAVAGGAVKSSIAGGLSGLSLSSYMKPFPSNGTTWGGSGLLSKVADIPICQEQVGPDLAAGPDLATGPGGPDLASGPGAPDLSGGVSHSFAGGGLTCAAARTVPGDGGTTWGLSILALLMLFRLRRRAAR